MKRYRLAARAVDRSMWAAVHGCDGWPELRYAFEVLVLGPRLAGKRDDARTATA